ncbi:MAG TPA: hypothetical protein VGD35_02295, partial [Chitinophaga sp.]
MKNWSGIYRLLAGTLLILSCQPNKSTTKNEEKGDSLAMREKYAESPVLDAKTALQHMQTEDGMQVQLVAAEPQVFVPVAMTF